MRRRHRRFQHGSAAVLRGRWVTLRRWCSAVSLVARQKPAIAEGGAVVCRKEAAGHEHGDLSGDASNIDRAPVVERPEDDLLDPADDELGDDLGVERPQRPPVNLDADVRRDDTDHMLIDLRQRLAHEAGAVGHAKDQARSIRISEHDLHDLRASRLDEGDVVLLRPCHLRWELEWRPVLDGVDDATDDTIDERRQDIALVGEVLVQGAPRDVRPRADVGDGRLIEAFGREHRERTVEDLVPAFIARQIGAAGQNRHAVPLNRLASCLSRIIHSPPGTDSAEISRSPSSSCRHEHALPAASNRFDAVWNAGCEAVGLPGLLFHDLRRSGARNYRKASVDEDVIQRIGGWKTASMFKRYNVVDERDLADAGARLSVFLAKASSATPTVMPQ